MILSLDTKEKDLTATFGKNLIMSMGESNKHGSTTFFSVADFKRQEQTCFCSGTMRIHESLVFGTCRHGTKGEFSPSREARIQHTTHAGCLAYGLNMINLRSLLSQG